VFFRLGNLFASDLTNSSPYYLMWLARNKGIEMTEALFVLTHHNLMHSFTHYITCNFVVSLSHFVAHLVCITTTLSLQA
jgi:hypothetical protein